MRIFWLCIGLICSVPPATAQTAPSAPFRFDVRVGVLAPRGDAEAFKTWQATADYLSSKIPNTHFVVVPLAYDAIDGAVRDRAIDFLTCDAATYINIESSYGATRIATRKAEAQGIVNTRYSGAIIVRADRTELQSSADLVGKRIIGTQERSFGGWYMQMRELRDLGINPKRDFASVTFAGTQDGVIYAVRDGVADAGAVRAGQLDVLAAEGKIKLSDFRVLDERPRSREAPFARSTRLYPEWPFVRMDSATDQLAEAVGIALLQMPQDSQAAKEGKYAGWTVPLEYSDVHDLLRILALPPYEVIQTNVVEDAKNDFRTGIIGMAVVGLVVVGLLGVHLLRMSRRIHQLQLHQTPTVGMTKLHATMHRTARVIGILVIITTCAVLVGWSLDIQILKSVFPQLVAMNPMTAVTLLLCAIALVMEHQTAPTGLRWYVARAAASLAVLIAVLKLLEIVFEFGIGVDQILFRSQLVDHFNNRPNRMAPNTAAALLTISLSLLICDFETRRKARPSQFLAIGAGLLALVAVLGYSFSVASFYGLASFIPMALHTAVCIGLLSLGILAVRPDAGMMRIVTSDTTAGTFARRLLPATVLAPCLIAIVHQFGERAELFRPEMGAAVVVVANVVLFVSLIYWTAKLLYVTDLERRRAEVETANNQRLVRTVIDTLPDLIYMKDLKGRNALNNQAHVKFLKGNRPDDVLGKTTYDFFPEEMAKQFFDDEQRVMNDGESMLEKEEQTLDQSGQPRWVSTSKIPFRDAEGKITGLVGISRDITARRTAELALQEKNFQLQLAIEAEKQATDQLKSTQSQLVQTEKLAGLGQMVAGVAHEINNPLSFVANNVAVLQRECAALMRLVQMYDAVNDVIAAHKPEAMAEIKELTERIDFTYLKTNIGDMLTRSREGLRRIQQIVKDLRDFARLDDNDLHESDVNAGIESTLNIILGRAKKKQIQFEKNLSPLPLVTCYAAKLNQVVMNLLSNAIDASPENSKIFISSKRTGAEIQIAVKDEGTGIDPAVRARIFDPFYTTKKLGEGTGLGLSISYGIVQDHGGRIVVDSTPGKGSTFTIHLPVRPPGLKEK